MKLIELLNEVTDQPYRYMLAKKTSEGSQYIFITDSGTKMVVSLALEKLSAGNTRVEVAFAEQTPHGIKTAATGKGDAFKIFATVAAIVKEFLSKTKVTVDALTFTGKTAEPSRIKLYDRIAQNLGKFISGFEFECSGVDGIDKFYYFKRTS